MPKEANRQKGILFCRFVGLVYLLFYQFHFGIEAALDGFPILISGVVVVDVDDIDFVELTPWVAFVV